MKDEIKLSVKGLAKFMVASPSQQRKILQDFKYPDPNGNSMSGYYGDARRCIQVYHKLRKDKSFLLEKAKDLELSAKDLKPHSARKAINNAKALQYYREHFSDKQFEVLDKINLSIQYNSVIVSIYPELHVLEKSKERIIKVDFVKDIPDNQLIKIICQATFDSMILNDNKIASSGIQYFDVLRGNVFQFARVSSKISKDIEAACENIEAIWRTITKPNL